MQPCALLLKAKGEGPSKREGCLLSSTKGRLLQSFLGLARMQGGLTLTARIVERVWKPQGGLKCTPDKLDFCFGRGRWSGGVLNCMCLLAHQLGFVCQPTGTHNYTDKHTGPFGTHPGFCAFSAAWVVLRRNMRPALPMMKGVSFRCVAIIHNDWCRQESNSLAGWQTLVLAVREPASHTLPLLSMDPFRPSVPPSLQ